MGRRCGDEASALPPLARGQWPRPRPTMSGCGRRAALEQDVARGRKSGFNARLGPRLGKDLRRLQRRRTGRHQRAGQLDQRADRAEVMGKPAWFLLRGDGGRVWRRQGLRLREADQQARRGRLEAVQMHVSEGQYELDGQREQRNARTCSDVRSEPTHHLTPNAITSHDNAYGPAPQHYAPPLPGNNSPHAECAIV